MNLPLSAEDAAIASSYLDSLDKAVQRHGNGFWKRDCVRGLRRSAMDSFIAAEVKSDKVFSVVFRFEEEKWKGQCDCHATLNCKHCAAVMFAVLDSMENNRSFPVRDEVSKKLAKPVTTVESTPEHDKTAPAKSFAAILRERLGRIPTKAEEAAAERVDYLFAKHGESRMLYEHLFEPLRDDGGKWGVSVHEVWPEPPSSAWEAWSYIVSLARRLKWKLLPALLEITDWKEVDARVAGLERTKRVAHWREWFNASFKKAEGFANRPAEMRVRLGLKGVQLEWRLGPARRSEPDWSSKETAKFRQMKAPVFNGFVGGAPLPLLDSVSLCIWKLFTASPAGAFKKYNSMEAGEVLGPLLRLDAYAERLVNLDGDPFNRPEAELVWKMQSPDSGDGDYRFELVLPDGSSLPPSLAILEGTPSYVITEETIYRGPATLPGMGIESGPIVIPAEALETGHGLEFLTRLQLPPPERISAKIRVVCPRMVVRGSMKPDYAGNEFLHMSFRAEIEPGKVYADYFTERWVRREEKAAETASNLIRWDHSAMEQAPQWVEILEVNWSPHTMDWSRRIGKSFPEQFASALAELPQVDGVVLELDPLIATLRDTPITARVNLEVAEVSIDWFDLRVSLNVSDTTLSEEEVRLLIDAKGGFVRLGKKGWRRLAYELDEEEEKQLADIGLSARDFSSEPQRLHALQLAGKKAASRLLPHEQASLIGRRAEEIRTRVTPELPAGLQATLRPYQLEGFHFLAYLTENHFGGILADDMGLGKTVQTLAWLLWLRARPDAPAYPSLVVCPKSVSENWASEVVRFAPELSVHVIPTGSKGGCDAASLAGIREKNALVVINYSQLRVVEGICDLPWHAVILDEAQYIKNPQSQTAQAANALQSSHRLALSGTPIENRLLDLWSILGFAMPGILGNRTSFTRDFDQKTDSLARRRLAARVRPFVLRRTKSEVAKDLPERIEEDLHCEMEGDQAKLYTAELKRARAALLKIQTGKELDKLRFNVLTSLLRLRQICCHPALVDAKATGTESAKLNALLDLLEPLVEEGQKVLVFSQFVQMLDLIKQEVAKREWRHLILTGETEDRGNLVNEFQQTEGSSIFLISLRAGGFGLNLTAASYVVLFDPWWNPAVEAQAIDRTHRIGQTSTVIAYRLLVKSSIEEKIRKLQTSKRAMAEDILGEENFTRSLSLEDFRFLLE